MSETFVVVKTSREVVLASSGRGQTCWEISYNAQNSLQERIIQLQMSLVLRLRNPGLDRPSNNAGFLVHSFRLRAWLSTRPLTSTASPWLNKEHHCLMVIQTRHMSQSYPLNQQQCDPLKGLPFSEPTRVPTVQTGHCMCHWSVYIYAHHP